jgi:hypothetical protein
LGETKFQQIFKNLNNYRIHKAVHITSNQYKYAAVFERGSHKLYDANFTMTTDGANMGRTTFEVSARPKPSLDLGFMLQSRFESHYLYTGNYQLNGHVEQTTTARNLDVNVLKNSQPLARLQATVPKQLTKWTGDEEKHVRCR